MYVDAANPARSVVQPTESPTMVPSPPIPGTPEPLEHCDTLRRLARGHLMACDVSVTECELRRHPVDAGQRCIATISTAPLPGTSSSSRSIAPDPNIDRSGGENHTVRVVRVRVSVRNLLVDRQPVEVKRVEGLLVDRKRALALSGPLPGGGRVDLSNTVNARRASCVRVSGREHRATAESNHGMLGAIEDRGGDFVASIVLKPDSPSRAKMSSIDVPVSRSIS